MSKSTMIHILNIISFLICNLLSRCVPKTKFWKLSFGIIIHILQLHLFQLNLKNFIHDIGKRIPYKLKLPLLSKCNAPPVFPVFIHVLCI